MNSLSDSITQLIKRGVKIHLPATVEIDPSVDVNLIAPGVEIHAGCRIQGEHTCIGPGCVLGEEQPVTLINCRLGERVVLKGGFFAESTFLNRVSVGSNAHVRPGCILEEEVTAGHAVGLKQTVLMPFVTLGSLINFCDCLMAGGTDRHNHSEVGSSYVHFNFTPHHDKATASLIGDVPRGVMIDQPPIFLGGQGGLVGPRFIEFGTVIAAGTICRRDITESGLLVFGDTGQALRERHYMPGLYGEITHIVRSSLKYIGNIHALAAWYRDIRSRFMPGHNDRLCIEGALASLNTILEERIRRLEELANRMRTSLEMARKIYAEPPPKNPFAIQEDFAEKWPLLKPLLASNPFGNDISRSRNDFLSAVASFPAQSDYITMIKSLPRDARIKGTAWLQSVVDSFMRLW